MGVPALCVIICFIISCLWIQGREGDTGNLILQSDPKLDNGEGKPQVNLEEGRALIR